MENNEIKIDLPNFNLEELQPDGTNLGTFKSVKTLKDAYDCLRKSFTKNAMELSKIKKEQSLNKENSKTSEIQAEVFAKQDINDENTSKNAKNSTNQPNLNELTEEILKTNEDGIIEKSESDKVNTPDNSSKNTDKVENTPVKFWESADWNQKVKTFFENNNKAKNYVKEIGQVLVQDKDVRSSNNPLQQAWIKVLEKKINDNVVNNEDLEEIVMKNDKIKQKVIQEYLNTLKSNKTAPAVISKTQISGAEIIAEQKPNALSMTEAKELAKKLLMK